VKWHQCTYPSGANATGPAAETGSPKAMIAMEGDLMYIILGTETGRTLKIDWVKVWIA
jgi:hypothetical protein